MKLSKIKAEDLIFSGNVEDDRTNTFLHLYDYDWMDYNLYTRFRTKELGTLYVRFQYFGFGNSWMIVEQELDGKCEKVGYSYPSELFKKHIMKFLEKHIASWNSSYAFNGEDEVIGFFNEVIDVGRIVDAAQWEGARLKGGSIQ